jgi:hypothetical protein
MIEYICLIKDKIVCLHYNNNQYEKINSRCNLLFNCSIWYNSYSFKSINNDVGVVFINDLFGYHN